jgi:hypothetical protein
MISSTVMPGECRASTSSLRVAKTWMAGTKASEATPFFERLCPAMTLAGHNSIRAVTGT